jgi:gas vesicle structural protein
MAYDHAADFLDPSEAPQSGLVNLLDRLLDRGLVLSGDIVISVADVDLVYVGLKLLVCSVDTAERYRLGVPRPADLERAA